MNIYLFGKFRSFDKEYLDGFNAQKFYDENDTEAEILKKLKIYFNERKNLKDYIFISGIDKFYLFNNYLNKISEKISNLKYLYRDTGYFSNIEKLVKRKYHRIAINNRLEYNFDDVYSNERFKNYNLKIKDWRIDNKENFILLATPSIKTLEFIYNKTEDEWINNTINEIRKYSNRKIVIQNKRGKRANRFDLFKKNMVNCHCIVTENCLIAYEALYYGLPVISLDNKQISNSPFGIKNIEILSLDLNRSKIFNKLAYLNYSLDEIKNGIALKNIKHML